MTSDSALGRKAMSRSLSSMMVMRVLPFAAACKRARCGTFLARFAFEKSYCLRIDGRLLTRGSACGDEPRQPCQDPIRYQYAFSMHKMERLSKVSRFTKQKGRTRLRECGQ